MIAEVGICASDLDRSTRFWQACLGLADETVAPDATSITLPAASGGFGRVRLWAVSDAVSSALADNPQPVGWRAAEVLVDDLETTFARVEPLARRVIGLPRWLGADPAQGIRAAQVVGPGGEVVYLTEVDPNVATIELPADRSSAGVFIAVTGTWAIDATTSELERSGYRQLGRNAPVVTSLNALQGTPGATTESAFHEIGGGTFIEVNQYRGEPGASRGGPIRYVTMTGEEPPRVETNGEVTFEGRAQ